MAGIGITLNNIFRHRSLAAHLYGFAYGTFVTLMPMFSMIGSIIGGQAIMNFSSVDYMHRELFMDTILYIFIFSLLVSATYNSVFSRYLSDLIYQDRYSSILPCFYSGLVINLATGALIGIPFCVHEYLVGGVALYYVLTSYCGFMAMILVFYAMLYLSISKSYARTSQLFLIGMAFILLFAWILSKVPVLEPSYALLLGLVIGFTLIASLEIGWISASFKENDGSYGEILPYMRKHYKTMAANIFYTLGLYVHNFVFWTTDLRSVLVHSFVTAVPYDMASCLAMFTNITAPMIFVARMEMFFHDRYRSYVDSVTGGRRHDIQNNQERLFRQLADDQLALARLQLIISVLVFLAFMIVMPLIGNGGLTMRIYPCLCVGYFIMFIMYAEILFLYYFNDTDGALLTSVSFCLLTAAGSVLATQWTEIWYGMGLVFGSLAGFTVAHFRLGWMEKHVDSFMFCQGDLIARDRRPRPTTIVFQRDPPGGASGSLPQRNAGQKKRHARGRDRR